MFEFNVVPVEPCDPVLRNPKTKPILFNTEMVKAILDGRKTQTRRIIKGIEGLNIYRAEPAEDAYETLHQWDFLHGFSEDGVCYDVFETVNAPCAIGDILWVRETFDNVDMGHPWYYKADGDLRPESWKGERWMPSIHMPKEAARIFLRVKYIYPQQLQNMSEDAAIMEGIADSPAGTDSPLERFTALWDTTIKRDDLRRYGYHANPWVWVIEFERCEKPEGWCVTD